METSLFYSSSVDLEKPSKKEVLEFYLTDEDHNKSFDLGGMLYDSNTFDSCDKIIHISGLKSSISSGDSYCASDKKIMLFETQYSTLATQEINNVWTALSG